MPAPEPDPRPQDDASPSVTIVGDGTPERAWRRSPWLAALPEGDVDALLSDARRVCVVSPHPDDEVLGCGGLILRARELGIRVDVVSVSDGEACYPDDPDWPPPRLRATRRAEARRALGQLGVPSRAIRSLGIPDGAAGAGEMPVASAVSALLGAGDLLLVTWRRDGHPDHEAAARGALAAARSTGARAYEFPVWAWHWLPAEGRRRLLPRARRYPMRPSVKAAKRRALQQFVSQTSGSQRHPPILPPQVLERFLRDYEVFCDGRA